MIQWIKSLSVKDWTLIAITAALGVTLVSKAITEANLTAAEQKVARLETEKSYLGQMLTMQNAAVDSLSAQREEDRKAYLAGIAAADKEAVKLEVSAERLLSLPVPPADQQCEAARNLLQTELTR